MFGKPQERDPHEGSQKGRPESCSEETSEERYFEIEGQESRDVSAYAEECGSRQREKSHIAQHEIEALR